MTETDQRRELGRRALLRGGMSLGAVAIAPACNTRSPAPRATPQPASAPAPAPAPATPKAARLRVVTYNVLADRVRVSERFPALFDVLAAADADILALQEVTGWIAALLHQQAFIAGYHASQLGGARAHPGGQYILSRHPIRSSRAFELPGRQRRTVLISTVEPPGAPPLQVATTHLESFLEDGPVRAQQLDRMFEALRGPDDALALGDFNFGDGEPEEGHLNAEFVDLWTALRPGAPGFTWDIERSEMARAGSFPGESSRRLDRVLLRSAHWRPASIEIIGDAPVRAGERDLFPSDHFGLAAALVTS